MPKRSKFAVCPVHAAPTPDELWSVLLLPPPLMLLSLLVLFSPAFRATLAGHPWLRVDRSTLFETAVDELPPFPV